MSAKDHVVYEIIYNACSGLSLSQTPSISNMLWVRGSSVKWSDLAHFIRFFNYWNTFKRYSVILHVFCIILKIHYSTFFIIIIIKITNFSKVTMHFKATTHTPRFYIFFNQKKKKKKMSAQAKQPHVILYNTLWLKFNPFQFQIWYVKKWAFKSQPKPKPLFLLYSFFNLKNSYK